MGRKGRARGRQLTKAFSPGAARGFAGANMSAAPRTVALGDAINALTGGPGRTNGLVIDDETRWMMRDPRDEVPFGPINPLRPDAIDPVRPDTKRPEPRLNEYPVAWNLPGSADAPMPWATLRAAAGGVDIMRRCISVRKEQLQGLDWSITLDDQLVQGMYAASTGDTGREDIEAELRRKMLPEIDRLTAFWRNPWKANGVSFEQWVNAVMEDHLVLDAVAIYPRMTYGGQLSAFEVIDATTIKLLLDYRGARPEPPFPAFQQILYGFPRAEFGSCYVPDGDGVKMAEGIPADQLFYFREEFRSFTPYGYSAVQQALISARIYLKRQGWMLAEYDDGSTPLTFLVPDATDGTMVEKLTPRTRRQWEDSINAELAGQTRARNRMKVLMPGMTPHQMQGVDERYKPDYDMHLIKMLAGHFGVTSTGLGFSESKGLGNSGLHEGQADVQQAATTKPDKRMIERIVNELMRTYQDAPAELRFKFTDPDTEDQAAEDASANAQRARGTITLNDDRKRLGKSPFTFPEADMPMALLGTGWVPIEGMAERAQQQADAEQALVDDQLATSEANRAAMDAEEVTGEDAEKALELAAYRRWARKRGGDARRPFICKALEPADWPGGDVPGDVDFAEWMWVPDGLADDATDDMIMKAFGQGNDNWRTLARDSRGRWVKRGSMRVDALGPSTPDKPVLASLRADAERRRAAAKPAAPSASAVDVTRGSSAADKLRRAELMHGTDRSKWPAKARQDAEKLERQLPVSDASSTMEGMTTPRKLTSMQHHVLGTGKTSSAGYLIADRRTMPALERAGLAEQIETAYGPQWVATPAGLAALERADADFQAELNARSLAKLTPELRARVAAIEAGGMTSTAKHDANVRVAIQDLQDAPGAWVAMADVRERLARRGMSRAEQDAAIRRLVTTGDRDVVTVPEDNQKTLTDADHAAAIDLGAGPQHLIMLEPPRRSVLDTVREGVARQQKPMTQARTATVGSDKVSVSLRRGTSNSVEVRVNGVKEYTAFAEDGAAMDAILAREVASRATSSADGPVTVREEGRQNNPGFALPSTPPAARPATEAEATAHADRLKAEYDAAQDRAYAADDAAYAADRNDAALNAAAVTAQAEADRKRREYDAAEADLNDRFIAPRITAERETKNRRMSDAVEAANAAREAQVAASAEAAERKRRDAELAAAMREQAQAERRAMFISRTPDGYASLLGGRASVMGHAPSRKLVETMRDQDWKLVGMMGSTSTWEAPDGRTIDLITQPGGKVAAHGKPGSGVSTMKAAHEYVGVDRPAARAEAVAASTPDAPSVDPQQKAAYDRLLDGGMVKHKQARQIVEQMEAHGWKLTEQNPMVQTTQWEAPDGRKITAQFLGGDKPKFYAGSGVGNSRTYRDALKLVVTPTHLEVGGPNVRAAAERVSPELGARVRDALLNGGGDDHVRRLDRAQRELVGYGSTPKRPVADIVADLRSRADQLDATAQSNAEHHERIGGYGESSIAVRQRREAGELRAIADVMDQQAAERAAYEAEVERRAGLPLDIRPTSRRAAKPTPAKRAEAVAASTPDAPMSAAEKRELGQRLRALDAEVREREAAGTVGLSRKQRDTVKRFERLAGEHDADGRLSHLSYEPPQ